jgi:hypothetical protein
MNRGRFSFWEHQAIAYCVPVCGGGVFGEGVTGGTVLGAGDPVGGTTLAGGAI